MLSTELPTLERLESRPRRRRAERPIDWRAFGPLAASLILCLAFGLAAPGFATLTNLQTIVEMSAVPLILATGISFVLILGSIDLSIEGVTALASMALALTVHNNINANAFGGYAIVLTLLIGIGVGLVNGLIFVVVRIPSLIVTLGTWFICLGVATLLFPNHLPQILDESMGGFVRDRYLGVSPLVYTAAAIVLSAYCTFKYTAFGRALYAIGGDEGLAVAAGIPVRRCKVLAFTVSGALAGLAGGFMAIQLGNGNASTGEGALFPAISAAVIGGTLLVGGRGGALHSAVGVLTLAVLSNGMIQLGVDPYARKVIEGVIVVAAVAAGSWHQRRTSRVVK